jgi:hypothetical protein
LHSDRAWQRRGGADAEDILAEVGEVRTKRAEQAGDAQQQRQRRLQQLRQGVERLRRELVEVQQQTRELMTAEGSRSLTGDEAAQARAVRRRSERLRWELVVLRHEYDELRGTTPPR